MSENTVGSGLSLVGLGRDGVTRRRARATFAPNLSARLGGDRVASSTVEDGIGCVLLEAYGPGLACLTGNVVRDGNVLNTGRQRVFPRVHGEKTVEVVREPEVDTTCGVS